LFDSKYKKELDNRDFKAITALALFISVASFILGTVKIMEGRDLFTSMSLLLVFGTGLLMFNLLIYWLSNKNEVWYLGDLWPFGRFFKKMTLRSVVILFLIGMFLLTIYYQTSHYKGVVDTRVDSLRVKTDSLKLKIQTLEQKLESSI